MPVARFEMPDGRIGRFEVPEGTTPEQAQALIQESLSTKQEEIKEPSMFDQAVSQTVGFIPSMARGVNKTIGGFGQMAAEGLEGIGVLEPGSAQRFTGSWNRNMLNVPGSGGQNANPVGEFVGEVLPYAFINPVTNVGRGLLGASAGLSRYSEEGPISPEDRAISGAGGFALGTIAKPVTDFAVGAGRVATGAGKSLYNAALGRPDAAAPLHEALTPLMQSRMVTGVGKIVNPKTTDQAAKIAPQRAEMQKWQEDAFDIERITGKKPEILLSQEMGSKGAAGAEAGVMKSRAADEALNELTKIQDSVLKATKGIGEGMRKFPVSDTRAGAALFNAHVKWEGKLTRELEEGAAENYGRIRKDFGDFPIITPQKTSSKILELADELDNSFNEPAAAALRKRAEIMKGEWRDFGSILDLRKQYARIARGQGTVAGLGREDSARIAADLVKSINDDILDAGTRSGNKPLERELMLADTAYREGYDALRKARDTTIGKLVDVRTPTKSVESLNKRARLSATSKVPMEGIADRIASMPKSEFTATMNNLKMIDPNIDRRIGRHLMDRAFNEAKRGGERMGTESHYDVGKLYDALEGNKVFDLLKGQKKTDAQAIMRWLSRTSDKLGSGGAAMQTSTQGTKAVMAASTMSAPFVIQAMSTIGLAPAMERAFFTEAGRKAMKTVMKYPNVNPAIYQKALEHLTNEYAGPVEVAE
jgi:hypothetical protein